MIFGLVSRHYIEDGSIQTQHSETIRVAGQYIIRIIKSVMVV